MKPIPSVRTRLALALTLALCALVAWFVPLRAQKPLPPPNADGMPSAPSSPPPGVVELRGVVSIVQIDDFANGSYSTEAQLMLADGSRMLLSSQPGLAQATNWLALDAKPVLVWAQADAVAASVASVPTALVVDAVFSAGETLPAALEPRNATPSAGKRLRYLNLLCHFADGEPLPPAPATIATWFDPARANSIPAYYAAVSYGNLAIDFTTVTQWRTMPMSHASLGSGSAALNAALNAECTALFADVVDLSQYDAVLFFTNVDRSNSWAFSARTTLRTGTVVNYDAIFLSWFGGNRYGHTVIAHEIGHLLGEAHTRADDGSENDYGNQWDVMSGQPCGTPPDNYDAWATCSAQDFIAFHKLRQGWIAPGKMLTVTEPMSVVVNLNWLAAPGTAPGYAVIILPVETGVYYTIEARKQDAATVDRSLDATALLVHEVALQRAPPAYLVAALAPDGGADQEVAESNESLPGAPSYYNHDFGFAVTIVGETATGYRVQIWRARDALADAPPPSLTMAVDDGTRGVITATVAITNTSAYTLVGARLVLDTGTWVEGFYLVPHPPQLGTVFGATCSVDTTFVRCDLPPIPPHSVVPVLIEAQAQVNATRLYRAYVFESSNPWAKSRTVVSLLKLKAWSAMALTAAPATQPVGSAMLLDVTLSNDGAMAHGAALRIDIPAPFRLKPGSFKYIRQYGVALDWQTWEWNRLEATLSDFWWYGNIRFQLGIEATSTAPPGLYPISLVLSQSAETPDEETADNLAWAVLCAGPCPANVTFARVGYLPLVRTLSGQ